LPYDNVRSRMKERIVSGTGTLPEVKSRRGHIVFDSLTLDKRFKT
jgi:hypothetical protein